MQSFDIIKSIDVENSFRVEKVKADFDVKVEHAAEHFKGQIITPEDWNIGVIVGGSGTGKSTIAKELYPENFITSFRYTHKSVIDDMPGTNMNEIESAFYSVGFSSVPSWLKPYSVLSNGEKMRVDLARAMLQYNFFVFDEFTSVVDRQVAETASIAIEKAIRKNKKKFIAVTCHFDIIKWLNPDWVFNTNIMKNDFFQEAHDRKNILQSKNATVESGQNLSVIII